MVQGHNEGLSSICLLHNARMREVLGVVASPDLRNHLQGRTRKREPSSKTVSGAILVPAPQAFSSEAAARSDSYSPDPHSLILTP